MRPTPLLYLPAMFATCMLFQTIYVACVLLWVFFPDMKGHFFLIDIFPGFSFLGIGTFIYGLIMSAVYGWFVSIVFIYFYNFWPKVAYLLFGKK